MLNKEGFYDIHIADAKAYSKMVECQVQAHHDRSEEDADIALLDAVEYKKIHEKYMLFLS